MRRLGIVLLLGALLSVFALPRLAQACPMCSETVPADSNTEEADQGRLSRAYNNSIYLMVGVPYFAVGAVGFMIYRQLRLRAAMLADQSPTQAHPSGTDDLSTQPGGRTCSPPSPGGDS